MERHDGFWWITAPAHAIAGSAPVKFLPSAVAPALSRVTLPLALSLAVLGTIVATGTAGTAHARGVSAYLPVNLAPEVERSIERVLILGDRPVLKRPIAVDAVLEALPRACQVDAELCERVRRYLEPYLGAAKRSSADPAASSSGVSFNVTHASGEGGASRDQAWNAANRHGLASDSPWAVTAGAILRAGDYLLLNLGGLAYDGHADATGTYLSAGFDYAQLDVGYRDHWLSPMTDSSMLIGSQAPTMPSVTLSNTRPISDFGLHYELFAAEMSRQSGIEHSDGPTVGRPRLIGLSGTIEPVSGFALGANRLMQFGGGARNGVSLGDVFDAFFRPVDFENPNEETSNNLGNQVASFTSRLLIPGRRPFALYFEYAGEDTSKGENWVLGSAALSAGVHVPEIWGNAELTYEVSDWQNAWYVNAIYPGGLSNEGHVLGHWFGDERVHGDAVGGQSHSVQIGWQAPAGALLHFGYRTLANEDYSPVQYERAHEVRLSWSHEVADFFVGAELQAGRDVFGDDFGRIVGFVRYAGAGDGPALPTAASWAQPDIDVDLFVDAGINAGRVRQDILDSSQVETTSVDFGPHFGLGARRQVGGSSDIGARLEFDEFGGEPFIAVRAIDYRYRFGNSLALTVFLGAARYDLQSAAYGYYVGAGGQLRNIADRFDLTAELRYGHKMSRDRVTAGEPTGQRPDSFFDVVGATLYLSYRL